MINLNSVMLGTMQPQALAKFYEKVFGRAADLAADGWYGWQVGDTYFMIGEHSEMTGPTKDPGRLMFNLETDRIQQDFERLRDLGATIVKEPYEMAGSWIATLADPDGNYFQLMSPWSDVDTNINLN